MESDEFYARSALLGDGFAMSRAGAAESLADTVASAEHRRRTEDPRRVAVHLAISAELHVPARRAAVATMDETRENVASYMADVAADSRPAPRSIMFRDDNNESYACCTAGHCLSCSDFGVDALIACGASQLPSPGVFVS